MFWFCRYSKVLEANLGNVYSIGALPACLALKALTPYPTNTTQPESLAQVFFITLKRLCNNDARVKSY